MANVPVALPPAPQASGLKLQDPLVAHPKPPAVPPTPDDIARAIKLYRDVKNSLGMLFYLINLFS